MKVVEIQIEEDGTKLIVNKKDMPSQVEMLFEGEVGDRILVTIAEMSDEEYKNLSEFTGW